LIEKEIADLMINKKLKLAIAESFTGGLITNKITNISGSSNFFTITIIPYDNKMKKNCLKFQMI